MGIPRLTSEARRSAIVAAVTPLFARKGFSGATTRELAETAGISEGLLFKHFPNKDALYQEILAQKSREGEAAFRRLQALEPSTASLIHLVHFLVYKFTHCEGQGGENLNNRHRLVMHSLMEDGEFAALVYEQVGKIGKPKFVACMKESSRSGDLVQGACPADRAFWLMHHLATMLAMVRLSGKALADVGDRQMKFVEETVLFLLRGIGLREEAIKLHYHPKILNAFLDPDT